MEGRILDYVLEQGGGWGGGGGGGVSYEGGRGEGWRG